jgi:hypothetical protein
MAEAMFTECSGTRMSVSRLVREGLEAECSRIERMYRRWVKIQERARAELEAEDVRRAMSPMAQVHRGARMHGLRLPG